MGLDMSDISRLGAAAQKQILQKVQAQYAPKPLRPKQETIRFTISLPPVTKKNSQQIVRRGNRNIVIPSKTYAQYEKNAGAYLYRVAGLNINYPVAVKCLFYMKTRRIVDLPNLLEAIDDVLVHYGVVEDDNTQIIVHHDGSRALYDKDNPRTEVEITRYEDGS